MHMAEKLVESAAKQKKSVFQFDTDTPKRGFSVATSSGGIAGAINNEESCSNIMSDSGIGLGEVKLRSKNKLTSESNSDDNGGFVTPPGGENKTNNTRQVKRATVVGNPMFSSSPDSDLGPGESLGLDDLDMDYEQIMHYFDNLKVSF